MRVSILWFLVIACTGKVIAAVSSSSIAITATTTTALAKRQRLSNNLIHKDMLLQLRGGEDVTKTPKRKKSSSSSSSGSSKKTKKKKKTTKSTHKTKSKTKDTPKDHQKPIDEALKEKDAAQLLGDAIRSRADELRSSLDPMSSMIDQSVQSLGWAMGASDSYQRVIDQQQQQQTADADEDDGGGIEASTSAVLVQYFLKSHGGAHALQSICSLLATAAGLGAVGLSKTNKALSVTLLRRCCLFAMIKHVSGLLAASCLTAKAIPEIGLRQARVWMEQLVVDPVSQYVFYAASVLFWLPSTGTARKITSKATKSTSTTPAAFVAAWWQSTPLVPFLLVGPIVLREIVSTALVISDVLVLWTCSSSNSESATAKRMVKSFLAMANSIISAWMSVLVTPSVWREATPAKRQAILAKLTSQVSLVLELAVGMLFAIDALWGTMAFCFGGSQQRPSLWQLSRRVICARLYLQFLWTRRKKFQRLATKVRGGAAQLPFYVLDVLMDPLASMGLNDNAKKDKSKEESSSSTAWKDYLELVLGVDSD